MKTIVLATGNRGKEEEIRKLFAGTGINIKSLSHFTGLPHIEETGATLEENALIKAHKIFHHLHMPVISDDTGLEVSALNMQPGVYSARYAGKNATYADNNRKLLTEMKRVPRDKRSARFRTVAAFVSGHIEHLVEGVCTGIITDKPHGSGGFGYDPLFRPDGFNKTFAELSVEEKNRISHRGRAFNALKDFLLHVDF